MEIYHWPSRYFEEFAETNQVCTGLPLMHESLRCANVLTISL